MKLKHLLPTLFIVPTLLITGCSGESSGNAEKEAVDAPSEKVEKENTSKVEKEDTSSIDKDLTAAVEAYREYGLKQMDQFVKDTESFVESVKAGDIEKAKELYPIARMPFERVEPIAEVLGEFDPKIDARENDVPEEEWTGYHRIEKGLWVDNSTEGVTEYADQLLTDVKSLRALIETVEVSPQLLVTGSVDLLNEVSASKVTGEEERYSHTDLYDFAANVQGSEKIFELLQPILEKKDAALSDEIEKRFDDVWAALAPYEKEEGYVLYTELTEEDTKKLSHAIDALAEPLSQIGIIL